MDEISLLLKSGAEGITKFPSVKKFNSKCAKQIEKEVKKAGFIFKSNLTKKPKINIKKEIDKLNLNKALKQKIALKFENYYNSLN